MSPTSPDPTTYPVVEIFHSLQGEGLRTGSPTAFVRLAGCNLRCAWCDTAYAQGLDGAREDLTAADIASLLIGPRVCLTGGEPLLHDIRPLLAALPGRHVTVETNGTIRPPLIRHPVDLLWSVAPKFGTSGHRIRPDILRAYATVSRVQWKLVIGAESDLEPAADIAREFVPPHHPLFIVPNGADWQRLSAWLWTRLDAFKHPLARLAPQLHVMVYGQERRCV